jgi:hypothetical protein
MSTFEDKRFQWRETYFVVFPTKNRPSLEVVQAKLSMLSRRYELINLCADEDGQLESLTVLSPDDFAALDVCYTSGEEVIEQGEELAQELAGSLEPEQKHLLKLIKQYESRFDVLHFEQVSEPSDDEEAEEMLDPSALLAVMEELARITGGIAIDPQSGTILSSED